MYGFFYGTLMTGHSNWNRILRDRSEMITKGILRGHRLYHSGFPVATIDDASCVRGEVFLFDTDKEQDLLRSLDGLEGYHESNLEGSMYHRITVNIHGEDGQTYECQTYRGNPTFWREFKGMTLEKQDDEGIYYWSR